jgi:hypothetical protein
VKNKLLNEELTGSQGPIKIFRKKVLSEFNHEAQNRLYMSQRIRKIIKFTKFINQYAASLPVSFKTGNKKVVIGPCRVAMGLSHPYQLKVVTDFVLHNFIQLKEKLILVDDLEWNYT